MTTPTTRTAIGHAKRVAVALVALLAASACTSNTELVLEPAEPIIDSVVDDQAAERTTTSLGLSANNGEDDDATADGPAGPMAFVDEERIEVSSDDPAIEPFVFYAEELGTGEIIDGLDLYRSRPTLIVFSVPTCPVCAAEAPALVAAAEKYPGIEFVIVHSQGDAEEYEEFVSDAGFADTDNVTQLVDEDLDLWRRFGVIQQPTSVLVDADGRVSSTRGALAAEGLDIVASMLELRELPTFDHLSPDRPTNPDS